MKKLAPVVGVSLVLCLALIVDTGLARGPHVEEPVVVQSPARLAGAVLDATAPRSGVQPRKPAQSPEEAASQPYQERAQVLGQYCLRCHNDQMLRGGMSLEDFEVAAADERAALAEKMIRKLRAGMMPPAGMPRPEEAVLVDLASTLENVVDTAAAERPDPGYRSFQRLNRAEYAASVEELLGLEIDVATFLPPDTMSANFDNIADVQMPSATLMEGYLRAAGEVARVAVGDPYAGPDSVVYSVPRTASQKGRVAGAPIGTRGGVAPIHNFRADGMYTFAVMLHSAPEGELFGRTRRDEQIEISIDGERVAVIEIDRWMSESDPGGMTLETDPVFVRAGARRVAAAFIRRDEGPDDDLITPIDHTLADTQIGLGYGVTTLPHLRELTVLGPHEVTGVSETATRRRIFTCRPTSPEEERPCAESIVTRLAEEAYRRPLEPRDVEGLMAFYRMGAHAGGFEEGIRTALEAILASPHFVFRMEETPGEVAPGEVYPIDDVDLASRLSFFLWGAPPDQELIDLAHAGELSDPTVLEAQVRRMLDDPQAGNLARRFAAQWLRLQDLEKVHPDALSYPYFDATLADAMRRETELLFAHLVAEDRSAMELLTAEYTFVNERLARHYGIEGVSGPEFRRVEYPDDRRRGILGHGSILTLTSHANRTSPVLRGKWVMEVLLGSPPPPPPPDVPDLEESGEIEGNRFLTVREQLEEHRSNPACRSCHRMMDPIGLAFEKFDVTGAWRIKDRGEPVDVSGELYDGTPLQGIADLRAALVERGDVVMTNFTENLMSYALGRRVEYYDMPAVRDIVDAAENDDYRISSFILGIVESDAFRLARMAETTPDPENPAGQ